MDRIKQLKNKIEARLPEIYVYGTAALTVTSIIYATYCKVQMEKFDDAAAVIAVEKTPQDEIILFLAAGGCLVAPLENIPVNNHQF